MSCSIDSPFPGQPQVPGQTAWPPTPPTTPPPTGKDGPPPIVNHAVVPGDNPPSVNLEEKPVVKPETQGANTDFKTPPHGYSNDWHTMRFSNTTNEPITVEITVRAGDKLPTGPGITPHPTDPNKATFKIEPGQQVDVTFAPGSSANFRSTKGDGSVWNQGEVFFDENNKVIWGNMSYIYGANSNMRLFSADGQHSGYLGDLMTNAPSQARVGNWGIQAPYDRFNHSDDPNNPGSATGGPNGPLNPGSAYLYGVLDPGEGYVHRGQPAQVNDYDDKSSLRFTGPMAVVF